MTPEEGATWLLHAQVGSNCYMHTHTCTPTLHTWNPSYAKAGIWLQFLTLALALDWGFGGKEAGEPNLWLLIHPWLKGRVTSHTVTRHEWHIWIHSRLAYPSADYQTIKTMDQRNRSFPARNCRLREERVWRWALAGGRTCPQTDLTHFKQLVKSPNSGGWGLTSTGTA